MKKMSKKYSISDYDKNVCLKLSLDIWLVIIYFLRPLMLQLSSIQMGRGNKATGAGGLRDAVYPDDFSLLVAILTTLPIIFLMIAWIKRESGSSAFIKKLWHNGKNLLIVTAILNIVIIFVPLMMKDFYRITTLGWAQVIIAVGIIIFLSTSQRVKDTFADFPENIK